ncbi:MAG: sigma-70 family RNA polymerase sigma factor [bacterium]
MQNSEFEQIYKQNLAKIYRFAYMRLNNRQEAEDISAEVFTALFKFGKLEEIRNISAWLFIKTRSLIINKYRSKAAKINQLDAGVDPNEINEEIKLEDTMIDSLLLEMIKNHLLSLDSESKEIIDLKVWEEKTFLEISEILETNENSVKSKYYRGIAEIKKKLIQEKQIQLVAAITLSFVFTALTQLKNSSELTINSQFYSSLLNNFNLSNVQSMENINPGLNSTINPINPTVAVSTLTKAVIGIGMTGAVVVTGIVGALFVNTKRDDAVTKPEPTISVSQKPGSTIFPTATITPTQIATIIPTSATKLLTFTTGNGNAGLPVKNWEITVPNAVTAQTSNAGVKFSGNEFTLNIDAITETEIGSFKEAKILATSTFSSLSRHRADDWNGKANYYYSPATGSDYQSTGTCSSYGVQVAAPCGAYGIRSDNSIINVVCWTNTAGDTQALSACDAMVSSVVKK